MGWLSMWHKPKVDSTCSEGTEAVVLTEWWNGVLREQQGVILETIPC